MRKSGGGKRITDEMKEEEYVMRGKVANIEENG